MHKDFFIIQVTIFFLYSLLGRDQVLIGIVPHLFSTQSAKSVYPMAIANCQENRSVAELK